MSRLTQPIEATGDVTVFHRLGDAALSLRERRPSSPVRGAVLYIHGATVGSVFYDLPVPGYSMLTASADAGWWSFALDLSGYGRSQRPASMSAPPQSCPLLCTGEDALRDIGVAAAFVLRHTGQDHITLAGSSWGSLTTARFAIQRPDIVRQLILMSPLFGARNPFWQQALATAADPGRLRDDLGGYRWTSLSDILARWDPEIPQGDFERRRDPAVVRAMFDAEIAADPMAAAVGAFRSPNGTLHELFEVFNGRSLYRPESIQMPCLLVRGAHDLTATEADAAQIHARLGTHDKTWVTIPDAGHFMQAERNAPRLHSAVLQFLRRGS